MRLQNIFIACVYVKKINLEDNEMNLILHRGFCCYCVETFYCILKEEFEQTCESNLRVSR